MHNTTWSFWPRPRIKTPTLWNTKFIILVESSLVYITWIQFFFQMAESKEEDFLNMVKFWSFWPFPKFPVRQESWNVCSPYPKILKRIGLVVFKNKLKMFNRLHMTHNDRPKPIAIGYLSHSKKLLNFKHTCNSLLEQCKHAVCSDVQSQILEN